MMSTRMFSLVARLPHNTYTRVVGVALAITVALLAVRVFAQNVDPDVQAKIENAMSAAPPAISQDATIADNEVDENGDFIILREGTNGWTCMPDIPFTPGNDPSCNDDMWMLFNSAFVKGEEPNIPELGIAYMLVGGSDPSNTDPMAMEPAEGEDWITTPPHIMLLFPSGTDLSDYPTDHEYGGPYLMWAGTPYQHIMLPVAELQYNMDEMEAGE